MHEYQIAFLRSLDLFPHLPEEAIKEITECFHIVTYPKQATAVLRE